MTILQDLLSGFPKASVLREKVETEEAKQMEIEKREQETAVFELLDEIKDALDLAVEVRDKFTTINNKEDGKNRYSQDVVNRVINILQNEPYSYEARYEHDTDEIFVSFFK